MIDDSSSIKSHPGMHFLGTLSYNVQSSQGTLQLTNLSLLHTFFKKKKPTTASLLIEPRQFSLSSAFTSNGDIKGSYTCNFIKQSSEKLYQHTGAFTYKDNTCKLSGTNNKDTYTLTAQSKPHIYVTEWLYQKGNKVLVNLQANKKKKTILEGTLNWSMINPLLSNNLQRILSGNNTTFSLSFNQSDLNHLDAQVNLQSGQFYIPGNYNLIKKINTHIQLLLSQKKIQLCDTKITLSKGKIWCKQASCTFTDNYNLETAHLPLKIDNVFINHSKDFYGITDGKLLLRKTAKQVPQLTGKLVLKKSLIKDTLFKKTSRDMYNPLGSVVPITSFPIGLDLSIKTANPVKAIGEDFSAQATVNIAVKCTPQKDFGQIPYVIGTINLQNGTLKLINHNLKITQGTLQFLENKVNDPLINIVAHSHINKYHVCLHASGSLLRPTVLLESTPELSEEQIIGLLCSGSEHSTLRSSVSSILLDQLKTFITKSNKKNSNVLLDKLSKPFHYVQITPNIDAVSGKVQGLKGSISVNVNDQVRAEIEKNLALDDKFSAQLEYLISDEVNIKVVKDHHGELGSEVELRLKL